MIEHLVFSGTSIYLLNMFGAVKYLHEKKYWSIENIKSIYGTSGGSMLGLLWQLNLDWKDVENYFIERPWNNLFNITPEVLFGAYSKRGLFDINLFKKLIEPLFKLKDISMSITFQELFEKTNIIFNVYATELNHLESVCFSHEKTPTMGVIDAIYYSSSIPPVFQPTIINDKCYLDGAIFTNYPIDKAYHTIIDKDTILGFNMIDNKSKVNNINKNTNIYGYFTDIFFSILKVAIEPKVEYTIKNELLFEKYDIGENTDDKNTDKNTDKNNKWKLVLSSKKIRKELIVSGEKEAEIFMKNNLNIEKE